MSTLQSVIFNTVEAGQVEAFWNDEHFHSNDTPEGWHVYCVRGGEDGWEPCSIENQTVVVNHTADITTHRSLDHEIESNGGHLTIKDWWFTGETTTIHNI